MLFQLAYQAKDFDKAIDYGAKHYAATGDIDTGLYLANAYYIKDDYPNTKKTHVRRDRQDGGERQEA